MNAKAANRIIELAMKWQSKVEWELAYSAANDFRKHRDEATNDRVALSKSQEHGPQGLVETFQHGAERNEELSKFYHQQVVAAHGELLELLNLVRMHAGQLRRLVPIVSFFDPLPTDLSPWQHAMSELESEIRALAQPSKNPENSAERLGMQRILVGRAVSISEKPTTVEAVFKSTHCMVASMHEIQHTLTEVPADLARNSRFIRFQFAAFAKEFARLGEHVGKLDSPFRETFRQANSSPPQFGGRSGKSYHEAAWELAITVRTEIRNGAKVEHGAIWLPPWDDDKFVQQGVEVADRFDVLKARWSLPHIDFLGLLETLEWEFSRTKISTDHKPKPTKRTRRRRNRTPEKQPAKPLTAKQLEAVRLHGEFQGNMSEVARRMGVSGQTARQHYDAANTKLGITATERARTRRQKADHLGEGKAHHSGPRVEVDD